MVLAKLYTDRVRAEAWAEGWEKGYAEGKAKARAQGYAEGYARGFREGERRTMAFWKGWNARRKQAEQAGRPFTEPEP